MKHRSLVESFKYAIEGVTYVVKTQPNMRLHLLIAILALVAGLFIGLNGMEFIVLCGSIALVLLAETLNTAAELSIDLVTEKNFHPLAKIIKNITAGTVLIASANAVVVGCILFWRHLQSQVVAATVKFLKTPKPVVFIGLILVIPLAWIVSRQRIRNGLYAPYRVVVGTLLAIFIIMLFFQAFM